MKNNLRVVIIIIVLSQLLPQFLRSQELTIGDKLPYEIWATLPKKTSTNLVILDFWNTWCSSCIASFPKMESLRNQFKGKLEIILVNSSENDSQVQERLNLINKNRIAGGEEKIKLPSLPVINGDSILKLYFPHNGVPHHVWLGQDGTVLAITSDYNATPGHVRQVLEGKPLQLELKKDLLGYNMAEEGYMKTARPELPSPVFYSGVMPFYLAIGGGTYSFEDSVRNIFRLTYRNRLPVEMFKMAFWQPGWQRTLIEMKDPTFFDRPKDADSLDAWQKKCLFSYEIVVPWKEKEFVNTYIQKDLNRFFGSLFNIEAKVESRVMNCLVLVRTDLPSPDKNKKSGGMYAVRDALYKISYALEDMSIPRPFINESEIDSLPVPIKLQGDLRDAKNVTTQLQKYGLNIIEAKRTVEVLVIRDKEPKLAQE